MVDNTPSLLWPCVLNEALDACLYLYEVSKLYTSSVIKQSNSKCFREAPIVPFHLTVYDIITWKFNSPLHHSMAYTNSGSGST